MNRIDLENKIAVITGGAQGFGYAIAKRFSSSGCKLILIDKDENLLKKVTRNNLLKKIVPQIESHTENFFSYKYKEGELMADLLSPHEEFNNLLNWCEHNLWIKPTLNKSELSNFKNNTKKFAIR